MLDIEAAKASQHAYYKSCDYAYGVNSIEQFAFTDAGQVPELFRNFAVEYFNLERYSRVDVDKLNAALNELWQGPGSAHIISDAIWDIRIARREGATVKDALAGYATPTVDSDLVVQEDGA